LVGHHPDEGGEVIEGEGVALGDPGGVLFTPWAFLFTRTFSLKVLFAGDASGTGSCEGPAALAFFLFCLHFNLTLPLKIS
jgi:hypothetical protein